MCPAEGVAGKPEALESHGRALPREATYPWPPPKPSCQAPPLQNTPPPERSLTDRAFIKGYWYKLHCKYYLRADP